MNLPIWLLCTRNLKPIPFGNSEMCAVLFVFCLKLYLLNDKNDSFSALNFQHTHIVAKQESGKWESGKWTLLSVGIRVELFLGGF